MTSADFALDPGARLGPHADALRDSGWVRAMAAAITPDSVHGKVVLDLHAGLGFRSLLAARMGAKAVFAVEPTCLANQARQIVADNDLSSIVTVLQCDVDRDMRLPAPHHQVDVILARWLGDGALFNSLVDVVLYARDRFLAADGVILPNRVTMHLRGIDTAVATGQAAGTGSRAGAAAHGSGGRQAVKPGQPGAASGGFWSNDIYGFDMSSVQHARQQRPQCQLRPVSDSESSCVTDPFPVHTLDVMECSLRDASFRAPFVLRPATPSAHARCDALALAFHVHFDHCGGGGGPVTFCTDPRATTTSHWLPTTLFLDSPVVLPPGSVLGGTLRCEFEKAPAAAARGLGAAAQDAHEGQMPRRRASLGPPHQLMRRVPRAAPGCAGGFSCVRAA